jgi:hypothetical protein
VPWPWSERPAITNQTSLFIAVNNIPILCSTEVSSLQQVNSHSNLLPRAIHAAMAMRFPALRYISLHGCLLITRIRPHLPLTYPLVLPSRRSPAHLARCQTAARQIPRCFLDKGQGIRDKETKQVAQMQLLCDTCARFALESLHIFRKTS